MQRIKTMEFLELSATIVFAKLMDSIKEEQHRKIINDPFIPLVIEKLRQHIETPWGMGDLYSLCHYYELNGDLLADPEMCFFVIDNRKGFASDWERLVIAPYMYQNAPSGFYQESVRIVNDKVTVFHRKMQKEHTEFANIWLRNIQAQGFLNK